MSCDFDYWRECLGIAADEHDISLTKDQLDALADAASSGHEHYGMAFYSPPASERLDEIRREGDKKLKALQAEFDRYRENAESAVKRALRMHSDDQVSIETHGDVLRYGGRIEQIQ